MNALADLFPSCSAQAPEALAPETQPTGGDGQECASIALPSGKLLPGGDVHT